MAEQRVYELDGQILLLGVGHDAECAADRESHGDGSRHVQPTEVMFSWSCLIGPAHEVALSGSLDRGDPLQSP
jgi:hypothetical protein